MENDRPLTPYVSEQVRMMRQLNENRGKTNQDIADAAGMSRAQITRYLSGRHDWPLHVLDATVRYLGGGLTAVLRAAEDRREADPDGVVALEAAVAASPKGAARIAQIRRKSSSRTSD